MHNKLEMHVSHNYYYTKKIAGRKCTLQSAVQCAKRTKVDLYNSKIIIGGRVSVLHIGPYLSHCVRGSRSGEMLEIGRGHSRGLMHGHPGGTHARANDWHGCYSRWRGATAPWNRILTMGWGSQWTFSSAILGKLTPYFLL